MTARERRVLVTGATAITGAFVLLKVIPAGAARLHAARSTLAEERALAVRARALTASLPTLRAARDSALAAMVALAPVLLGAGSGPDAQAELSVLVDGLVSRHGVTLAGSQPLPDSAVGGVVRAGLRLEAESDLIGLARLLADLEADARALAVPELSITAPQPPEGPAPERLAIRLTVVGWYLPRSATP